jgi:predicted sulfurtransferase/predicted O-methyltransferase YrrM
MFEKADYFFQTNQNLLKRPSLLVFVSKDPNAPAAPPPPLYLQNLADPSQSDTMTMLSFYAFPPGGIENPDDFATMLRKLWKPFHALGRVYVAHEGVNAQMSVPTNVLDNFMQCCKSVPELGEYIENGINVDPKPLTMQEFAVAGVSVNGNPAPPFRNLHIRVRGQVVADGLDKPLDWQSAGYDMPPMEWHETLKKVRQQKEAGETENVPLIFDCRNDYETDVGIFEGAEPLDTANFRDSWDVFKERLKDTPKDAPIMTYCTGGIRCVKVGAYLTQEMGFTNVSRLAGGIIAYDRTLNEKGEKEEPMFKGTNFVFDGRLGRPITEDSLGTCVTCGAETSLVSNCRNDNCHKRMIQCEQCRTSFHGTCSDACRNRVVNGAMIPKRLSSGNTAEIQTQEFKNLEDYSSGHSSPLPSVYPEMEFNTRHFLPSGSHMVSGASQGRWLTQLASMSREGRVLECGTFTGFATACLLEGAANAGESIGVSDGNRNGGPYVMTMERDGRAIDVAVAHLKVLCEYGVGEEAAEAACALRGSELPHIEDEVVSLSYKGIAGCEIVRVTDALATLEEMAQGQGTLRPAPFDIVFIDADKTRLLEYVEACVSSDLVLKKGGIIIVDNVLWKGLVLEASTGDFSSSDSDAESEDEAKKSRRARKLATKMHTFNSGIVKDERVEVVVLPMRDGLSVIRKR